MDRKSFITWIKDIPRSVGGLLKKAGDRRASPTRELPKMEPQPKELNGDAVRGFVPRIQRELSALFRVAQTKPKRFVTVAFDQARVEVVYADSVGDDIKVLAYDTVRVPPEREERREVVEEFLAGFLSEHKIPEREAVVSLPGEESVLIHSIELPVLPKAEVLNAGKWKLKEDISFDLETAVIDWCFTRERTAKDGSKNGEYMFTVAQKEAINKYLDLLSTSGLHPVCITVGPFNYANILKKQPELPQVSAVLDTDYMFATLSLYVDGELCFVRKLPVSWRTFTRALTRILVSEEGPVTLTEEEAERLQTTVGIPLDDLETQRGTARKTNIVFLLRPVLEALVRELRLSFNYFAINFDMEKPRALFLVKTGLRLKNLDRYLHKELNMPVSWMSIPQTIEMPSSEESSKTSGREEIVNAVGAALSDTKTVDLLPWEIKAQRYEFFEQVVLRFLGLTLAVILAVMIVGARAKINDYRNRIKIANVHLRVIGGIKVMKEDLRQKEDLVVKINKGKIPVHGLLKIISTVIPDSIVIRGMSVDQTGHSLILRGSVSGGASATGGGLSEFMQRLEDSDFIEEARLISSHRVAGDEEFEISCDLAY